jgi:hypothetical protein
MGDAPYTSQGLQPACVRSFLLRVVKSTRSYHGSTLNISEVIQLQDELTRPSFSYSKTSTAASRVWDRFVL